MELRALTAHAREHGSPHAVAFSPNHVLLGPPGESRTPGLIPMDEPQRQGSRVIPYTVNAPARMRQLMEWGVDGLISDSADLLREEVARFHDGRWLAPDGAILPAFSAQGHRGSRDLRPENTLPAFELALDLRLNVLETDAGVTADGVAVLSHNVDLEAKLCRRLDQGPYPEGAPVLLKDVTLEQLQTRYAVDRLLPDRPRQRNDASLSPVAVAFARERNLRHPYVVPSLAQLFDFVAFYAAYYRTGEGAQHPEAALRAANAERVEFNVETKVGPEFDAQTLDIPTFTRAVLASIRASGLTPRVMLQSFDPRSLRISHREAPLLRTAFLFEPPSP